MHTQPVYYYLYIMNKINSIDKTINDIKSLRIQGATNVAKESVRALGQWTKENKWDLDELKKIAVKLAEARPTEPLTQNTISEFLQEVRHREGDSLTFVSEKIIASLNSSKERIIENGTSLIKKNITVLTHCHSSTVTGILKSAKRKGTTFKVYLTETRPLQQGHITAEELVDGGINATMITDSEASYLISREDSVDVDMVLLGADAIEEDGSAINKVGSYGISLSAKHAHIPLYITATLLKYSPVPIIIEERSGEEIWATPPAGLKISNPAFDKIPSKHIHSFITEYGLIKPVDIKNTVKKHYPWIFINRR